MRSRESKLESIRERHRQILRLAREFSLYQFEQLVIQGDAYTITSFKGWEQNEDFKLWLEEE